MEKKFACSGLMARFTRQNFRDPIFFYKYIPEILISFILINGSQ